jgi:hypothetical protein
MPGQRASACGSRTAATAVITSARSPGASKSIRKNCASRGRKACSCEHSSPLKAQKWQFLACPVLYLNDAPGTRRRSTSKDLDFTDKFVHPPRCLIPPLNTSSKQVGTLHGTLRTFRPFAASRCIPGAQVGTPIHELERYMQCKNCAQVRGYAHKRSHLVAIRHRKISASYPPSTWWPGER